MTVTSNPGSVLPAVGQIAYSIAVASVNGGNASSVQVSLSATPPNVVWSFSPSVQGNPLIGLASPGYPTTLTITTSGSTPGGLYQVTATGQNGHYSHYELFTVPAQGVAVTQNSGSTIHNNGQSASIILSVPGTNIQTGSVCGTPAGSSLQCAITSSSVGNSVTLQITAPSGTPHGQYGLNLSSGGVTAMVSVGDSSPVITGMSPSGETAWGSGIPVTLYGYGFSGCIDFVEDPECWQGVVTITGPGSPGPASVLDTSASLTVYPEASGGTFAFTIDVCAPQQGDGFYAEPNDSCVSSNEADLVVDEQASCPYSGVTPYTPDPYGVDIADLTATTQANLTCLQTSVQQAPGALTVVSGYRPQAYQDHLGQVWSQYQQIGNMNTQACAAVKSNVQAEWNLHHLSYQPAAVSNHTSGMAFDATWSLPQGVSIDALAQACNLSRCVPGDTYHFCSPQ